MSLISSFSFYGLKVSTFTLESLIKYLKLVIFENGKIICYGYSLGIIPYLKAYPIIYTLGESSELLVTDGRPFYLLMKLLKFPVQYEISIPGLTNLILKLANQENYGLLLLGGTKESNKQACYNIAQEYHNIRMINGIDGYFKEEEESDIVKKINYYKPNILFIGMSSPKKDLFTVKWKSYLSANIIIPCGGMIEVYAKNIKETPKIIKRTGLASIYRLIQEPRRLFRRYSFIYSFLLFKFLPVFFIRVLLFRESNFSIPRFCKIYHN